MGKINVKSRVMGPVETNCYIVYDEDTKKAIIVDPAENGVYDWAKSLGLEPEAAILTHGHFDHIMGSHELQSKNVRIYALDKEENLLRNASLNLSSVMGGETYTVNTDGFFADGQKVTIAGMTFTVISTPGHTAGSCCYYFEDAKMLFSGDTMFMCSVGRSDFPTGNESEIVLSARRLARDYPEDVSVYPGHGESTSIGYEKKYNPFCRG